MSCWWVKIYGWRYYLQNMPKGLDPKTRAQIAQYRALNYSQREIAETLGIAESTVQRHLRELEMAAKNNDPNTIFWERVVGGLLGAAVAGILLKLLSEKEEQDEDEELDLEDSPLLAE